MFLSNADDPRFRMERVGLKASHIVMIDCRHFLASTASLAAIGATRGFAMNDPVVRLMVTAWDGSSDFSAT